MNVEEIRLLQNLIDELKLERDFGIKRLRGYLSRLNYTELKTTLMQFDTEYLETICKELKVLEFEKYEILQAVDEILTARAQPE